MIEETKASEVEEREGVMMISELIRCRVRYFSDGLALGSEEYLQSFLERRRELFSERRTTGARRMRGGDWGEMRSMRALVRAAIVPPDGG